VAPVKSHEMAIGTRERPDPGRGGVLREAHLHAGEWFTVACALK